MFVLGMCMLMFQKEHSVVTAALRSTSVQNSQGLPAALAFS